MPEFLTTDDFASPRECLSDVLEHILDLHNEKRIKDVENVELLIDSYRYAIELLEE